MRHALFLFVVYFAFGSAQAGAQNWRDLRDDANANTVGIMGGGITGTSANLVWEMANAVDNGYELRVVPMMGQGSVKTIEDMLVLRGVDIGIVQSDVLSFYEESDPNIKQRIAYIARFYNEEMHLIVRGDIDSIGQLEGKRVNFGPPSSGTFMTSSILFDRLDLDVEVSSMSYADALEMMRRQELDAMVRVAGKPTDIVADIPANSGFKLLGLSRAMIGDPYIASSFSSLDYPNLVPPGDQVETIAVSAVMAAYDWPIAHPRRVSVEKFVRAFPDALSRLQEPGYHPKWHEVDLSQGVPGWRRFALSSDTDSTDRQP